MELQIVASLKKRPSLQLQVRKQAPKIAVIYETTTCLFSSNVPNSSLSFDSV